MAKQTQQEEKQTAPSEKSGVLFLPNFCGIRVVFAVVVICELLAIILSLVAADRLDDLLMPLSRISLMVQWIGLSSAALICVLRNQLNRFSNWGAGLASLLILLSMTLLVYELIVWLNLGLDSGQNADDLYRELLPRALAISLIVGVLVLHYLYLQHLWRCQEEAENSARLQALYSRIRPHFLFNSMNTIASLTRSDPKLAEEVVEDLADLFRVSLGDAARPSTLGRELALARQYLSIEHYRLADRLEVVWSLDEDLPEKAGMPPMILQPLLENAVYHGIEPAPNGGRVTISGHYRRKRLNLSIRNTLPEAHQTSQRQGNQLAMENIRARLAGVYDLEASLTEAFVDGEYQVRLVIPHPWWG